MLFADVRGSTNLAEMMSPIEYSRLINRFYNTAAQVMIHSDALIDKIIGDQVSAMYTPGFAGADHARRSLEAAQEILSSTGHKNHGSPWIPLGVGIHTGIAFVGSVGEEGGTTDITVLGDAANTAARLASSAQVGEILISEAAYLASGLDLGDLEVRNLTLKGKSQPVQVHVMSNY
ncbi:MAG: adenylate/guanylate cyclase domain-containing protein [candidate division Zixibacteria bacterium]|nr:adenylate/guanylate cyclase domain-containing protein [candidate division Zixibacteria bacterium]